MRWNIAAELQDVYGGDGIVRTQIVEKEKLRRQKTSTEKSTDGMSTVYNDDTEEVKKEKMPKECQTFRLNEAGKPILRMGGAHGKLWGALRESAAQLWRLGEILKGERGYNGMMAVIYVNPVWIELKMPAGVKVEMTAMPQELNKGSMIFPLFDYIPRCSVSFEIEAPDMYEQEVELMLEHLQKMAILNKRRTVIKITSSVKDGKKQKAPARQEAEVPEQNGNGSLYRFVPEEAEPAK